MTILERARELFKQKQDKLRLCREMKPSDEHVAICAAVDEALATMRREIERIKSRQFRHESRGDAA